MTNKIFSKTVNKTTLLSVILAVILAAALVIGVLFGFNKSIIMDDNGSLTVSVNTFAYNNDKKEITKACEKAFGGKKVEYVIEGEMSGDSCELVFVFDKKVDVAALEAPVKAALEAGFPSASFNVSASTEVATAAVAKHFVLRAAIAVAVFSVLAFAYASIRHQSVWAGISVGGSVLLAMLLTAGILVLARVPVTVSAASAIAMAGLLTAASTAITVAQVRAKQKTDAESGNEALVLSSIAVKESVGLGGFLASAMVLVGILGKTAALWYAVAALVAIAAALAISLFFAPALYLSLKGVEDRFAKKAAYVGAKKTSKKEKKEAKAKAALEAVEVAEAPVEEAAETEETAE